MDHLVHEGLCLESEYDKYLDACERVMLLRFT